MTISYSNNEVEIDNYIVEVEAEAEYDCYPARMCMANGDPGYPSDGTFELGCVDAVWHEYDEDGNDYVVEPTEEMKQKLYDFLYEEDWDLPEDGDYEDCE